MAIELLQSVTIESNTTGITLDNIPSNGEELLFYMKIRSNADNCKIQFNDNAANDYSWVQSVYTGGGSANALYVEQKSSFYGCSTANASSAGSQTYSATVLSLPAYARTTLEKVGNWYGGYKHPSTSFGKAESGTFLYSELPAISKVSFITDTFYAGTTNTLY